MPQPALCGEISTLSKVHSGLSSGSGSTVVTSSAAPPMRFAASARISASSSTRSPRPTLMNSASRFMRANSASPNRRMVSGSTGRQSTTASACGSTSCNCSRVTA